MLFLTPSGKKYKLVKGYSYRDITVPEGYETDGISCKFRLVGVLINKFDPRYMEAVVVHDYLTDLGDWDKANRYFEELLPITFTAKVMVKAVNIYKLIKV